MDTTTRRLAAATLAVVLSGGLAACGSATPTAPQKLETVRKDVPAQVPPQAESGFGPKRDIYGESGFGPKRDIYGESGFGPKR